MARSTLRWSHVNHDRFFSTKRLPYCRMMSATSKGGWFIAFAASGAFDIVGVGDRNCIQRVGHGAQMPLRQMQVNGRVLELGMAQQQLDRAQVGAGFKQV